MISGTCWIRRGAAATVPEKFRMTEEQYKDIITRARFEIEDAKTSLSIVQDTVKERRHQKENAMQMDNVDEELKKFKLDKHSDYDDDDDREDLDERDLLQAMSNIDGEAFGEEMGAEHVEDEEEEEEEEEEDKQDLQIRPTDNLLVAARTEDDISCLEVYVYEEADGGNLYVHHDIMLPSFPLAVEWIGEPLSKTHQSNIGNFVAVGTFEPEIEIWNLDVLETPYPDLVLGQREGNKTTSPTGKIKKRTNIKKKIKCADRHTDAVMSLSWNRLHSTLLLSGSADTTVKLWDLHQAKFLRSFDHHQDKVQTLQWNPAQAPILASAAYDKRVKTFDCRTPSSMANWKLLADPECLRWNPHAPTCFTVSDEEGKVLHFDTRKGTDAEPIFTLQAHAKPVTSIDWNPAVPDCLLTISADKTIKLWNTRDTNISCVVTREVEVGKAFSGSFCVDAPNLACVGGSNGVLSVLNILNDKAVVEGFRNQYS